MNALNRFCGAVFALLVCLLICFSARPVRAQSPQFKFGYDKGSSAPGFFSVSIWCEADGLNIFPNGGGASFPNVSGDVNYSWYSPTDAATLTTYDAYGNFLTCAHLSAATAAAHMTSSASGNQISMAFNPWVYSNGTAIWSPYTESDQKITWTFTWYYSGSPSGFTAWANAYVGTGWCSCTFTLHTWAWGELYFNKGGPGQIYYSAYGNEYQPSYTFTYGM